MTHLLRGKQAGIQIDLSAGLGPELFVLDDINRYGINSQITALAYDPVQSLLAVGTKDSQFGPGQIYVFGQKRICVTLSLPHRASVKTLQFCADKLVCVDSKHDLSCYSLELKRTISSHSPPGVVTSLATDPTLDYALLGMQNDRENLVPFKIPNLWTQVHGRARVIPVIVLAFHPRDIGTLLIGYHEGAVIYSFKQNKAIKYFQYELPRGAPGGDADPTSMNIVRRPKLTQAVWHPTGTFVLTGHEDGSLVVWDVKDGRIVMARTLQDTNINQPSVNPTALGASQTTFSVREPLFRIAWCANQDPDDTGILIAGGAPTNQPTKGLTFFEMGRTPNYATASWQVLSEHFESPRRQRILPTPPNAEVVDFCLIPRTSPHFAGACDPIAILALLSSGEVITLSFPSGLPISPTNQLHVSMTFVHPFIKRFTLSPIERTRWLGMTETRAQGPPILKGGTESAHPLRRYETRNIVQTAHADGTVRLWDAGHGDELENEKVLQVDVARAVGRLENVQVTQMSLAGASGEFATGLHTGEVVIFRWGHNRNAGKDPGLTSANKAQCLTNIADRADPSLTEGLCPFTLLDQQNGPVTALKLSDVGFVAAGFEGGSISVIDLRGPAVIYTTSVQELASNDKRGSLKRSNNHGTNTAEHATVIEFSVMGLDGEDYSSILLHIGTNLGHLLTFKIVPEASGRYIVQFAASALLDDRVLYITPLRADSGHPAYASQSAVGNLRNGNKTNGIVLAVTQTGIRIFKPANVKGAHKSFDGSPCHSAALVRYQNQGYALVGLFGDGYTRAYSIPAMKEIGSATVNRVLDIKRVGDAVITPTGNILGWTGPSEMALLTVWGKGEMLPRSKDKIFNPDALIPPRPTISNFQWVSGTQYITPSDMDLLIGGPDRPPSKRMLAQSRADDQQRLTASRTPGSSSSSAAVPQNEGWGAYMQRQINERTEKLNIMGDSMERLENNSAAWADDVGKFVAKQKRNAVGGIIKSRFGL
ncbi:Lethal(2) giant larvae sro7 [Elasticomyces elasticus]|nr:Lethal(2) giant larvae sro7 [Elasticomyces elasticus]